MWKLLTLALERLCNYLIAQDPKVAKQIAECDGQLLHISISDYGQDYYLLLQDHPTLKIRFLDKPLEKVDTQIVGKAVNLLKLLYDPNEHRGITIKGNIELAQKFASLLQDLDID